MFGEEAENKWQRESVLKNNAESIRAESPPTWIARWEAMSLKKGMTLASLKQEWESASALVKTLADKQFRYHMVVLGVVVLTLILALVVMEKPNTMLIVCAIGIILVGILLWRAPDPTTANQKRDGAFSRYEEQLFNFVRYIEPLLGEKKENLSIRVLGSGTMLTELTCEATHLLIAEENLKKARSQPEISSENLLSLLQAEIKARKKFQRLWELNEKFGFGIEKGEVFQRAARSFKAIS